MAVARREQKALDERIKVEGGDQPVQGGKSELKFSSVTPQPPKKTTAKRPTRAAVTVGPVAEPVKARGGSYAKVPHGGAWTVKEAARLLDQQYSPDRVVSITGFTLQQIKVGAKL